MHVKLRLALGLVIVLLPGALKAGEADVLDAAVRKSAAGEYNFDVTVAHQDEGWSHYADKWDVLGPEETILGTRTLLHPHVGEQPFTRSLSGVEIPAAFTEVTIRAHDSVHGYGGATITIQVP